MHNSSCYRRHFKIIQAFEENFEIKEEEFSRNETTGHFDNPITHAKCQIEKKEAEKFIQKLLEFQKNKLS